MNWNEFIEIKNKEKLIKSGRKCIICGDYGEKVKCKRCEGKYASHNLCMKCFSKMTAEIHDRVLTNVGVIKKENKNINLLVEKVKPFKQKEKEIRLG